jgi:hypothetical protein
MPSPPGLLAATVALTSAGFAPAVAGETGLGLAVGTPQGAFADQVGVSGGLHGHALLARRGPLALRLEGSTLLYGSRTLRLPVPRTSGRISDEVTTDHWASQLTLGPQLMATGRGLRPYASALAGVAYMSTTSRIVTPEGFVSAASTNDDDAGFAYGAAAGVLWPMGGGDVALDVGIRYGRTSQVRFLTRDDLHDTPSGLRLTPHRGHANLLEVRLGVAFGR